MKGRKGWGIFGGRFAPLLLGRIDARHGNDPVFTCARKLVVKPA